MAQYITPNKKNTITPISNNENYKISNGYLAPKYTNKEISDFLTNINSHINDEDFWDKYSFATGEDSSIYQNRFSFDNVNVGNDTDSEQTYYNIKQKYNNKPLFNFLSYGKSDVGDFTSYDELINNILTNGNNGAYDDSISKAIEQLKKDYQSQKIVADNNSTRNEGSAQIGGLAAGIGQLGGLIADAIEHKAATNQMGMNEWNNKVAWDYSLFLESLYSDNKTPSFSERVGKTISSIIAGAVNAPAYAIGSIANAAATGGENLAKNNKLSMVYATTKQWQEESVKGFNEMQTWAWQTGTSIVENLTRRLFSGGSEILNLSMMAVNVASQSLYDTAEKGGSYVQGLAMALANASAEILTEKIPFKHLKGMASGTKGSMVSLIKSIAVQAGEEFAEESINEIAEMIADMAIMKDDSEMIQYYNNYLKENPEKSKDKAFWAVLGEATKQVALAGLSGAVSGGVQGTGATILGNTINAINTQSSLNNAIKDSSSKEDYKKDKINLSTAYRITKLEGASDTTINIAKNLLEKSVKSNKPINSLELESNLKIINKTYGIDLKTKGFTSEDLAEIVSNAYDYKTQTLGDTTYTADEQQQALIKGLSNGNLSAKTMDTIDALKDATGLNVVFATMDSGITGVNINGNNIVINTNTEVNSETLIEHEYVHYIKKKYPDMFKKLESVLNANMNSKIKIHNSKGKLETMSVKDALEMAGKTYDFSKTNKDVINEEKITRFIELVLNNRTSKVKSNSQFATLLGIENKSALKSLLQVSKSLGNFAKRLKKGGTELFDATTEITNEIEKLLKTPVKQAKKGNFDKTFTLNGVDQQRKESTESLGSALGIEVKSKKGVFDGFYKDGKKIDKFTIKDMENTPLNTILKESEKRNIINHKQYLERIEFFADFMNMIINMNDPNAAFELVGTTMFSIVKSNSDAQYKWTIDYATICKKTESMMNAMSTAMKDRAKNSEKYFNKNTGKYEIGLTKQEVVDLYDKEVTKGNLVPCPYCYVFSRWLGVGGILNNIYNYQKKYANYTLEQLEKAYDKASTLIKEIALKTGEQEGTARASLIGEYSNARNIIDFYENIELTDQERWSKYANKYKSIIKEQLNKVNVKSIQELNDTLDLLSECSWLKDVRMDKNYKPVRDDVLFDLNKGAVFAEEYSLTWKYRSNLGAGAGKAITPYADSRIGGFIEGILSPNKQFKGEWGTELLKKQINLITRATKKQKRQNLVGGTRIQSYSDFKQSFLTDYLLDALQLELIGAKVQGYTKVIEAVDLFASLGYSMNMSIAGESNGVKEDKLVFSNLTGMNYESAVEMMQKYPQIGTILVGGNNLQINIALNTKEIRMVIPYHKSGHDAKLMAEMVRSLGEFIDEYVDYSDFSEDKIIKIEDFEKGYYRIKSTKYDLTPYKEYLKSIGEDFEYYSKVRTIRKNIIAGNKGKAINFTDAEMKIINNNKYLKNVYTIFFNENSEYYHTFLPNDQAKRIFPYEFWDKNTTYDTSKINSKNFIEYCISLGIVPRFCIFTDNDFYWKTIVDRNMYDYVTGKYVEQPIVSLDKLVTNREVAGMKDGKYVNLASKFEGKTQEYFAKDYAKNKEVKMSTEVDSDGNQLTVQQQEYFADSKARDNDGNLLKVYTGTDADFTVFDKNYIGKTGRFEGSGFNFTPSKSRAKSYGGKVLEGYVNVSNPISSNKKTMTINQLAKLIREIDPTGDNIISNYAVDSYDYGKQSFINRESLNTAKLISKYNDNDADIYAELSLANPDSISIINKYKELGYDGLIHYGENNNIKTIITFDSNQFKNANNLNPTENDDIRYSTEEDVKYIEAIKKKDLKTASLLVEKAAKKAGYTEIVYHGTTHEFTKFDPEKLDDGFSIFVTDSEKLAETYSGAFSFNLSDAVFENSSIKKLIKVFENSYLNGKIEKTKDGYYITQGSTYYDEDTLIESESELREAILDELRLENMVGNSIKLFANPKQQYIFDANKQNWDQIKPNAQMIEWAKNNNKPYALQKEWSTREISEWAKNNGYLSIKLNNIYDIGGYADNFNFDEDKLLSNITAYFDINLLKSADAIVYDDNGRVIPLSERFTKNDDFRYSTEKDSEGNQLTFQQQEYFVNSKVRDDKGNLKIVYHGTTKGGFNQLDKYLLGSTTKSRDAKLGMHFTDNLDVARMFSKYNFNEESVVENGEIKEMFLNITKPLDITNPTNAKILGKDITYILTGDYELNDAFESYEDVVGQLQQGFNNIVRDFKLDLSTTKGSMERMIELGYDGIILPTTESDDLSLIDVDKIENRTTQKGGKEYIIFESNQAKNITNLNPSGNNDFRYSTESDLAKDIKDAIDNRIYDYDTNKVGRMSDEDVRDFVVKILNNAPSINQMYLEQYANDLAQELMDNIMIVDDGAGKYNRISDAQEEKKILDKYKHKIRFTEELSSELKYRYDKEYKNIALQWKSKDSGASIEDIISELINQGIMVSESDVAADMIIDFLDYYSSIQNSISKYKNPSGKNAYNTLGDEKANKLKEELFDSLIDILKPIVGNNKIAENQANKKATAKAKLEFQKQLDDAIAKLKKYNSQELEKVREETTIKTEKQVAGDILNLTDKIKELDNKIEELVNKNEEIKQANRIGNRIVYNIKVLTEGKTDSTLLHDEDFLNATKTLKGLTNRGNIRKSNVRGSIAQFSQWYKEDNPTLEGLYDPAIREGIDNLLENRFKHNKKGEVIMVKGEQLLNHSMLSYDELQILDKIIQHVKYLVKNYDSAWKGEKRVILKEEAANAYDIADKYKNLSKKNKVSELIKEYGTSIVEPRVVIRSMFGFQDNNLSEFYDEITKGENKAAGITRELTQVITDFFKENNDYRKSLKAKVKFMDKKISKSKLLSIYKLYNQKHSKLTLATTGFGIRNKNGYWESFGAMTDENVKEMNDLITEQDRQFLTAIEKFFEIGSKYQRETDINKKGYSDIVEGSSKQYFPINRKADDRASNMTQSFVDEMTMNAIANMSITKKRIQNLKQLEVFDIEKVLDRYAGMVGKYSGLAIPIKEFQRLYNVRINTNLNKPVSLRNILNESVWKNSGKYLSTLIQDLQGINRNTGKLHSVFGKVRGVYAKYQLGANLKVIMSQMASFPTAFTELSFSSMSKVLTKKINFKDMDKYCLWAANRNANNEAAKSETLVDKWNKITDIFQKPISLSDRFTIGMIWNACQFEVEKNHKGDTKYAFGTESNMKEAGVLLEQVGRKTQPNYTTSERTGLQRTQNEILKTFAMFTAVPSKQISRLVDTIGEANALRFRSKTETISKAEKSAMKHKLAKVITAITVANIVYILMAQLVKHIFDKDREDKDGNEVSIGVDMLKDFASTTIGMLPFVKDLYSFIIDGYDIDAGSYLTGGITDMIESTIEIGKYISSLADGDVSAKTKVAGTLKSMSYSIGQLTGIPTRNIYNTIYGLIKRFSPSVGYKMDKLFYGANYLTKLSESDNDDLSITIINEKLKDRNLESNKIATELYSIYKNSGNITYPRSVSQTISYNGKQYTLNNSEYAQFKNKYNDAINDVEELIDSSDYQSLTDSQKIKAINSIFDNYYYYALNYIKETNSYYGILPNVCSMKYYALSKSYIATLESDKDKNGNSIAGTKKSKFVKYVYSLNISNAERCFLIAINGYSLSDIPNKTQDAAENLVKKYINMQNITDKEKRILLNKCGIL